MWKPPTYLSALHFAAERHACQLVPGTSLPIWFTSSPSLPRSCAASPSSPCRSLTLSKNKLLPKGAQLDDSLARIRDCPKEVWVVKLADRITNLQPPPAHWDGTKRRKYQAEARRIHEALGGAHRVLGERLGQRIEGYTAYLDPRS